MLSCLALPCLVLSCLCLLGSFSLCLSSIVGIRQKYENEVGHPFERGSGLGPTIYSVTSQSAQVRGHGSKRLLTTTMIMIMTVIMTMIMIMINDNKNNKNNNNNMKIELWVSAFHPNRHAD